jgi:hypothetical protein
VLERDGVRYFDRRGPDPGFQSKSAKPAHDLCIEIRNRPRAEGEGFDFSLAGLQLQGVIDEIEVDLKTLTTIGDRSTTSARDR